MTTVVALCIEAYATHTVAYWLKIELQTHADESRLVVVH